jgi:hypothetical protein
MPSFLSPLIKSPDASFVLRSERTGALVATRLEPAFERQTRNKGLLGRTGLSDGHALVIAPCNGVHTFFMKFTIDVFFLSRGASPRRTPLRRRSRGPLAPLRSGEARLRRASNA